jgi:hypothetical protein
MRTIPPNQSSIVLRRVIAYEWKVAMQGDSDQYSSLLLYRTGYAPPWLLLRELFMLSRTLESSVWNPL